jgi:hypothetical protein
LELPGFGLSKDGGVEGDVMLNGGVVTSLLASEGAPLFQGGEFERDDVILDI